MQDYTPEQKVKVFIRWFDGSISIQDVSYSHYIEVHARVKLRGGKLILNALPARYTAKEIQLIKPRVFVPAY